MTKLLAGLFQFVADNFNNAEKAFLDLLSALVPYAVPIIPAYLTYYHTLNEMQFPQWVAWTSAFVVEALGLASVSTAIRFWAHNRRYKDVKNKAPLNVAISVYAFYVIIIITVNVIFEIMTKSRNGWTIFAIALFSLLSFPSGVLISVRRMHSDILDTIHHRTDFVRSENEKTNERRTNRTRRTNERTEDRIRSYVMKVVANEKRTPGPTEVAAALNVSKSYASEVMSGKNRPFGFAPSDDTESGRKR